MLGSVKKALSGVDIHKRSSVHFNFTFLPSAREILGNSINDGGLECHYRQVGSERISSRRGDQPCLLQASYFADCACDVEPTPCPAISFTIRHRFRTSLQTIPNLVNEYRTPRRLKHGRDGARNMRRRHGG